MTEKEEQQLDAMLDSIECWIEGIAISIMNENGDYTKFAKSRREHLKRLIMQISEEGGDDGK
jgi:cytosine/uracil/thiamine/allantoin permease